MSVAVHQQTTRRDPSRRVARDSEQQLLHPTSSPFPPPVSPHSDLSTSLSPHVDRDSDPSDDLLDPSTPPPSRSSTMKMTPTQVPLGRSSSMTAQSDSSQNSRDEPVCNKNSIQTGPPPPPPDSGNENAACYKEQTPSKDPAHVPHLKRPSTSSSCREADLDTVEERATALPAADKSRRTMARRPQRTYADTDDEDDDSKQLSIGTRIAEGHRNYPLMYDMLTGIRIAVGRVSAKLWRDLCDDDFKAAHKLVFDVTGNELTPGVKYDFKFKDYAPWVFRHLRERFHVDAADYMMSLTNKYILSELSSPGKSKSFFYYSKDYRFIIKTIHHAEHRLLRRILKQYYNHVCENPNTLLSRFYGLHRIKLPRGRKIHFIVMGNVFPASKDLHLVFDLKGSTYGRMTPEQQQGQTSKPAKVLKDQNWIAHAHKLHLGPEKQSVFVYQLERDVALLARLNIMDYSMLIGIHDMERGNADDPTEQHLHIVKTKHMGQQPSFGSTNGRRASQATFVRNALKNTNSRLLDKKELPQRLSIERKHCVFYADDGGFQATNADNQCEDILYFVGIIDILTPYNTAKKTERFWKSITQDKHTISSVPAGVYGERFLHFMKQIITP